MLRSPDQMTALSQATHFRSLRQQQMARPRGNRTIAQRIPKTEYRAGNEQSRLKLHNHEEGPYYDLLLVERHY